VRRVLLATAAAMVMMPAGAARAASMYGDSQHLDFGADLGERNDVTIVSEGAFSVVHDAGAPLTAIGSCVAVDAHTARCQSAFGGWDLTLRDGDDSVHWISATQFAAISGGEGDDTLDAPAGGSTIWGDAGNDTINGGAGPDTLNGGGGNDLITPGLGEDFVTLGAGVSRVDARDAFADGVTCLDGGTATVLTDPFDSVTAC
jgi:Ca2+-binding RTX toxin-like protein